MWIAFVIVVTLILVCAVAILFDLTRSINSIAGYLRDLTENTRQIENRIGDISLYAAHDRLTPSSLAEILDNQRKAKKRDALCLSCENKECLDKKDRYFVCKRYVDTGL